MHAMSVATDAMSAIQRPSGALPSPTMRISSPAAIGNQIRRLSSPIPLGMILLFLSSQQPGKQRRQADDHCERVVIQVPRLRLSQHGANDTDALCRAIDRDTVDQDLIAHFPEQAPDPACQWRDDVLVEPVRVVLVDEYLMKQAQTSLDRIRP